MAFCKNNIEAVSSGKTLADNIFITEYMPYLNANEIKVYLFGLFLCQEGSGTENTFESFCKNMRIGKKEIDKAFEKLESEGLVEIVRNGEDYEVRFPPISNVVNNVRKFNKSKYGDFNVQIQNIIEERMITPNEYAQYYSVIESLKIEPEALILVAKYCTNLKGKSIGHNYITTVAKNFAYAGAKTVQAVNEKLLEQERNMGKIKQLLTQMKIGRVATIEEREMFLTWKKDLKFSDDIILFAQKTAYKIDNFNKLNSLLSHYSAMDLKSEREIEGYEKTRKEQFETAKEIVKKLGLYYQNVEPVVEQYVSVWFNKGYEKEFLTNLAKICFTQGVRTLDKFDERLSALYKKGILDNKGLEEFSKEVLLRDEEIKKILSAAQIDRSLTNFDRSMYNTWLMSWGFAPDVILHAAQFAKNTINPIPFINKILQNYKESGIRTLEQAKNFKLPVGIKKVERNYDENKFSQEKLSSVFANLDDLLKE